MSNTWLIASRELRSYFRSPLGYVVIASVLLIDGLWFQSQALGGGARLSADVLREFFNGASGTTMIAAVVMSMRLIAQERERGTLVLLNTAPIHDREIVLGKFLALFLFLSATTLLSVYMPLLIFVNGKVSIGQILVGYAGIFLLAAAAIAIGVFASALARTQVLSAILAAVMVTSMLLLWLVAKITDAPINTFVFGLALHNERQIPFMLGVLRLENVVYYVAVTYFFLLAAIKTLEARRWR